MSAPGTTKCARCGKMRKIVARNGCCNSCSKVRANEAKVRQPATRQPSTPSSIAACDLKTTLLPVDALDAVLSQGNTVRLVIARGPNSIVEHIFDPNGEDVYERLTVRNMRIQDVLFPGGGHVPLD